MMSTRFLANVVDVAFYRRRAQWFPFCRAAALLHFGFKISDPPASSTEAESSTEGSCILRAPNNSPTVFIPSRSTVLIRSSGEYFLECRVEPPVPASGRFDTVPNCLLAVDDQVLELVFKSKAARTSSAVASLFLRTREVRHVDLERGSAVRFVVVDQPFLRVQPSCFEESCTNGYILE